MKLVFRSIVVSSILVSLLLLFNLSVVAQTHYYVSKQGNDSNAGTSQGAPLLTIQAAIDKVTTGTDFIHVTPGVYAGFFANKANLSILATTWGVAINSGAINNVGATITTGNVILSNLWFHGTTLTGGIYIESTVPAGAYVKILGNFIGTTVGTITKPLSNAASNIAVYASGNSWNAGVDPVSGSLVNEVGSPSYNLYTVPYLTPAESGTSKFPGLYGPPSLPWGDITLNYFVSAYDASKALKHAVASVSLTGTDGFGIGDVNADLYVDETDAGLILDNVVETISGFTVEGLGLAKEVYLPYLENPNFDLELIVDRSVAKVNVSLRNADEVKSSYIEIDYDTDVLEFKEFRRTTEQKYTGVLIEGYGVDGKARIASVASDKIKGDLEYGQFIFAVKKEIKDAVIDANNEIKVSSQDYRINGYTGRQDIFATNYQMPTEYELLHNYPNPFNPVTTIAYRLPEQSDVVIEIYNVLGQIVNRYEIKNQSPGTHKLRWNGTNRFNTRVASGVYFYRFKANNKIVKTHKMMLLK